MNTKDKIAQFIARKLPARIIYWAGAEVLYYATGGTKDSPYKDVIVDHVRATTALGRYRGDKLNDES